MTDRSGPRVGEQIGNYRLVGLLGQGGFAEVYLGQHIFLNTEAAIKVLSTRLAQPEQESFLNEARIIARLIHPHIVRVLDFGMQDNSIPYLVMDYAPHGSLREQYPKGARLPLSVITSYVNQIASALQYAHDEKLIHRDVKPENMLLGRHGEILLSDFGISVVTQATQSQSLQEAVGTVPYMAPEQIQGKPRPASDQYALGIIVYEWACGERPFQGGLTELYGQHIFQPPPPLRERAPEIPTDVEQVVMTALAKDPHQRFSNIHAFALALEQASRAESRPLVITPPEGVTTPSATTTTIATPPTLHTPPTVPSTPLQTPTIPITRTPLTGWPKVSRRVAISGLAGLAGLVIAGTGVNWYVSAHRFLPQGTLIYTFPFHTDSVYTVGWKGERIASGGADKTVKVWGATNGSNALIYTQHTDHVNTVAWSPDGSKIASGGTDNVVLVWDASNGKTLLSYKGHQSNSSGIACVAWSPDGRSIASCGGDGTVQVWDAVSGHIITTYKGHFGQDNSVNTVYTLSWSPDGTRIASGAADRTVKVWDASNGKTLLSYEKHNNDVSSVAWSPDGKSIASASADKTVQVWDPAGNYQQSNFTYSGHTDVLYKIAWSSDGQYIASASADTTVQIWSPVNGAKSYIYKRHSKQVFAVAWAEDSHRVTSGGDDTTVQVWEAI